MDKKKKTFNEWRRERRTYFNQCKEHLVENEFHDESPQQKLAWISNFCSRLHDFAAWDQIYGRAWEGTEINLPMIEAIWQWVEISVDNAIPIRKILLGVEEIDWKATLGDENKSEFGKYRDIREFRTLMRLMWNLDIHTVKEFQTWPSDIPSDIQNNIGVWCDETMSNALPLIEKMIEITGEELEETVPLWWVMH